LTIFFEKKTSARLSLAALLAAFFGKLIKSLSTTGSKIFRNGQKQPFLKLCLLKAGHEQVIKSTLFFSSNTYVVTSQAI